jgi:hypothetical protein
MERLTITKPEWTLALKIGFRGSVCAISIEYCEILANASAFLVLLCNMLYLDHTRKMYLEDSREGARYVAR